MAIPSAETIGGHDDMLIQILVHVPVRSLLRFKCVSKHWYSIISSSYFSRRLNQIPAYPSALILPLTSHLGSPEFHFLPLDGKPSRGPFRSLNFVDDPAGIMILQSCNGLLLCRSNYLVGERCYYVYNPTTNQYTVLPRATSAFSAVFGIHLAFDPSKSVHYRVVLVRSSDSGPQSYQLEIYSSDTCRWRLFGEPFDSDVKPYNGVFCHGAIHWMSGRGRFLCFDLDQERFRHMPALEIPEDWDGQIQCRFFGASQNHLQLILGDSSYHSRELDVYEMERDYSRWFIKYRIDLNNVISAFPEMIGSSFDPLDMDYCAFQILAVIHTENEEGSFAVLHIPGKAISYVFKDQAFRILHDFAPGCTDIIGCLTYRVAYEYIENFSTV
ncbi:hypothetical protein SLEP1_g42323 [Rubroshorea leprosula]|uniref:F-box domain-containing protein n=1 Tax=Rubroshorea leprosula TaxID=152421 RepID=A0AAV5LA40_9ROSI|nr:hypothetical protein SLEP1_g42323 [Rubroshorea leprosula]